MTSSSATSPPQGPAGISERYRSAAHRIDPTEAALLPTQLAAAAVEVTSADAAGLSVMSHQFRVPLGASDAHAATIERLQFTAEQGPCWDAVRADLPLAVDHDEIVTRWPQFAVELHRATPFRSIVAIPLRLARGAGGAMDLYFRDPVGSEAFDLDDGTVIAAHIADLLNRADSSSRPPALHGTTGPAWALGAAARRRQAVWIAVGMVMNETDGLPADALAVLRAASYSANSSLDDVAAELIAGRITVADLTRS